MAKKRREKGKTRRRFSEPLQQKREFSSPEYDVSFFRVASCEVNESNVGYTRVVVVVVVVVLSTLNNFLR